MNTNMITEIEIEFLKESNAIEKVYDPISLDQAVEAWRYLQGQKSLGVHEILETHKILMAFQPLKPDEIGKFRRCGVVIGGRVGIDYRQVPPAIANWSLNVLDLLANGKNESVIFKERLVKEQHVAYEKIHPFVDGNGRTGRIFMNWERLQLGLPILVIKESEKHQYYEWFD